MTEEQSQTGGQQPPPGDRGAWRAWWSARGQPWRQEPEVAAERAQFLAQRRGVAPNVGQGIYPFAGQPLTRADVEWLLATHDENRGPVDWSDEALRAREGLDLRGADLRRVDLRGLPLARLHGGTAGGTDEQQEQAAIRLDGANLAGAQLQGAELRQAHLENADLRKAALEGANLAGANLAGADLREAQGFTVDLRKARLQDADLRETSLVSARMQEAQCERARFGSARLDGANLDKARFKGALMQEASLAGASCRGTYFTKTYLRDAHLDAAYLLRAHLEDSQLEGAFLHGAEMRGAYLQGANLYGASLEGRRLAAEEAERLRQARQWRPIAATLQPADLRGAFMDHGTNLRHARLGTSDLGYVLVADVSWGGANLAVVDWSGANAVTLGDEREARRRVNADGSRKDRATRLKDYTAAVRANRQLAVALRAQGLDEDAARFAYRAQVLQRRVALRRLRLGSYFFSLFLDGLAGYGYKPGRSVVVYLAVIFGWAAAYYFLGQTDTVTLSPLGALVFSVTSFHGRGFFPGGLALDDPLTVLAAAEAILGLLIELSFIATFTQRFFGK
jgi:uncharacterized protein YjbI with pentapeptide repeats